MDEEDNDHWPSKTPENLECTKPRLKKLMENVCRGKLGVTHGEEKWLILRSGEIKETERKKV